LINAAIQAASSVNAQPWFFSLVRDKGLLARISNASKSLLSKAPPAGVLSHHLQELLADPTFDIFYAAPVLVVISSVMAGQ